MKSLLSNIFPFFLRLFQIIKKPIRKIEHVGVLILIGVTPTIANFILALCAIQKPWGFRSGAVIRSCMFPCHRWTTQNHHVLIRRHVGTSYDEGDRDRCRFRRLYNPALFQHIARNHIVISITATTKPNSRRPL